MSNTLIQTDINIFEKCSSSVEPSILSEGGSAAGPFDSTTHLSSSEQSLKKQGPEPLSSFFCLLSSEVSEAEQMNEITGDLPLKRPSTIGPRTDVHVQAPGSFSTLFDSMPQQQTRQYLDTDPSMSEDLNFIASKIEKVQKEEMDALRNLARLKARTRLLKEQIQLLELRKQQQELSSKSTPSPLDPTAISAARASRK